MDVIFVLFAVCAALITCNADEASVIAPTDAPPVDTPPADALPASPLLGEEQPVGLPEQPVSPESHQCLAVTSSDLFLSLVNLQCPPAFDPLCVLSWPFDVKPASNKFHCGRGPASDLNATDWLPMVHLINASAFVSLAQRERPQQAGSTELEEKDKDKEKKDKEKDLPWCMIVSFYAPYCPFSARLAPYYNALPRAFPRLYVIAVDATDYSKLNSRYGITGTPTVILWHNGKAVARFDDSDYSLKGLSNFLQQWTDLEPARGVDIVDEDLLGPLPSQPIVGRDYYLLLSWLFILFCVGYYAMRSAPAARLLEAIRTNFREANE